MAMTVSLSLPRRLAHRFDLDSVAFTHSLTLTPIDLDTSRTRGVAVARCANLVSFDGAVCSDVGLAPVAPPMAHEGQTNC